MQDIPLNKSEINSNLNFYRFKKDLIRKNLIKYTRKAFNTLPKINKPRILDIGCGTGVPTIELAELSNGHIVGIDIDETSLNTLRNKIKKKGLDNQINVFNNSISTMDFPEENFDIIWTEGSIFVLGFEKSIKNWYRFLKTNGFLVIHDENKDKVKKLELTKKYGYNIIDQFDLSESQWWDEYYIPLEKLIQEFSHKYANDTELSNELKKDQIEIDKCKANSVIFSSFFVILQKL
jgi:ubiquinone/menaquinone biosynthesis C-methylase UbiE